jgi:hypothetical protein
VFQVTDPSGHYLLSMDPAKCRVFEVEEGIIVRLVPPNEFESSDGYQVGNGKNALTIPCHIADDPTPPDPAGPDDYGPSGQHDTNVDVDHGEDGAIVVQLMPFGTTPNPGGVYKAWIIPFDSYDGNLDAMPQAVKGKKSQPCPDFCASADPGFGPPRSDSKTDNFKVKEFYPPEITVRKFHDMDGDGIWDPDEPEIGVDEFIDGGGWPYWWTYPLDGGYFTEPHPFYTPYTHVAGIPGWYTAEEEFLTGWAQSAGRIDGVYRDFFTEVLNPLEVYVLGFSHEIHEIVFGNTQPGRIHGRKVIDLNGDGDITGDTCPLDPDPWGNNAGCQGVTVYLDGEDNLGRPVHWQTLTDEDGYYEFTDVWPGAYTVTVGEPAGFECSYPAYGACNYDGIQLLSGDDLGPYDFGDFSRAEVYGRKVIDITGDGPSEDDTCPLDPDPWGNNAGCQGVLVDLDGHRRLDGEHVHLQTYTDENGYFEFLDLYPGDYTIALEEPDGFYCSYPDPCYFALNLMSDEIAEDLLFGDLSKAEVHGRKVIDIYADGPSADDTCPLDPDPWGNNAGCQDVTIYLDGTDGMGGQVHLTTQTDDNGYFEFLDLWPGEYTVTVGEPDGFFCSYPDPCYFDLELMSDEIADGLVFGDYSKAEVHAYKCFDADESGTCDEGESPVAGIEFCLYDAAGALVSCQTTGDGGWVHWVDLMPGTYTVEETLPPGWFCTNGTSQTAKLMSDEVWTPKFGNVTNCVGLTPGYWSNWDNHYTPEQFAMLLQGTVAEGESLETATFWLSSVGCDGDDALHCMRRFLLANQLTLNLTHHPELPNPDDAVLWYMCEVPGVEGNLGHWLDVALGILADPGGYDRDYILWVKTVLDRFANLDLRYFP